MQMLEHCVTPVMHEDIDYGQAGDDLAPTLVVAHSVNLVEPNFGAMPEK